MRLKGRVGILVCMGLDSVAWKGSETSGADGDNELLGLGYLLTASGNWLSRQGAGCFLLLSHTPSGKQEEIRQTQMSPNPGCPGTPARVLICLEYVETAASFLKALKDCQWNSDLVFTKIMATGGFLGGPVVENLPCNAEDTGSIPGLGRSHVLWSNLAQVAQLLSRRALEPMLHNERSHSSETPSHGN